MRPRTPLDSSPVSALNRREAMVASAAALVAAAAPLATTATEAAEPPAKTSLGLVIYDCAIRRRWLREQNANFDLYQPSNFLEHARRLGAGGIQASLGAMPPQAARALRDAIEKYGMFLDAIVSPPQDDADVSRFEAEIRTAAEAGARAARTVIMPGRRYEQFKSLEEFRQAAQRGEKALQRAAPIVKRHRLPLAVENHKDQRIDERVALYHRLSEEYIGACVDTGNSFALLDDPYEAIEALAPYAFTVHLKDQALREYEAGFFLGDIPLGQGSFDLPRMVQALRRVKPEIHFVLELITRDPLKVPCLTPEYWATLQDVPGSDLARALTLVRQRQVRQLQYVSQLTLEQQVALEDSNVATSLRYARETLNL